ncbi:hypothetical protein BCR44DRAFT_1438471 [Catenaria anguillulae PL171]|uniref:Ankyrin repeat-containing domain protein n=1 Tax=Catenaria anguillulae PL171 TaxID=765915 RepID=A0A1Y2HHF1_9FUNG|nr:hypothetical protein BCR44DRAFT_1438471 [Catenaria anguillulae PL171]
MQPPSNVDSTQGNDTMNSSEICPTLPLELAESVLVAAIRSIRYIRRSDAAKQAPYLNVALRSVLPEVTKAAIARQVWVDMDHASACGDVELLNLMVRMSQLPEYSESLVLHYTDKAMHLASERGHIAVLNWWVAHQDKLPLKYWTEAMDRASALGRWIEALRGAAKAGHVHVLDWWLQSGCFDTRSPTEAKGFLDCIGKSGRLDVLDWLLANKDAVGRNWTTDPYTKHMAIDALRCGNVHVLDWMLEHEPKSLVNRFERYLVGDLIDKDMRNSLEWLAQHKVRIPGNDGVMWAMHHKKDKVLAQWLLDTCISQVTLELFLRAFERADVEYVEWCYERLDVAEQSAVREADKLVCMFLKASLVGSVDCLNWIVNRLESPPALLWGKKFATMAIGDLSCMQIQDCLLCASQNGYVAVLDWLVKNGITLDRHTFHSCVDGAIRKGRWQVLEWLSNDPVRSSLDEGARANAVADKLVPCVLRYFDTRRASDYIHVLEWIRRRYPSAFDFPQPKSNRSFSQSVALLEWWDKVIEQPPQHPNGEPETTCLDSITDPGVLNWWLSSDRSDFEYTSIAIDQASADGKLDLLDCWKQFALAHARALDCDNDEDDHPLLKYTSAAMDNASRNGHLEVLEWWESSGIVPLKYSKRALKFTPFVSQEKRAEIVRWWLSSGLP